jgi:hypothetical protein
MPVPRALAPGLVPEADEPRPEPFLVRITGAAPGDLTRYGFVEVQRTGNGVYEDVPDGLTDGGNWNLQETAGRTDVPVGARVRVYGSVAGGALDWEFEYERAAAAAAAAPMAQADGRLTLTTGVPVTTADVTGTTLYYTPYVGNRITLWGGTAWATTTWYSPADLSVAVPNVVGPSLYDVFAYPAGGQVALELGPAWTGDITRATAVVPAGQTSAGGGVYVKSGNPSRRYLGTILVKGGNVTDSKAARGLWNLYNQQPRHFRTAPPTTTAYTYTTATWRLAGADAKNSFEWVQGLDGPSPWAEGFIVTNNSTPSVDRQAALIMDGTDPTGLGSAVRVGVTETPSKTQLRMSFTPNATPALVAGRHVMNLCEWSAASGTTTWQFVDNNLFVGGILGHLLC